MVRLATEAGGSLVSGDTYYDERGECWTLVEVPDDPQRQDQMLRRLGAREWKGLVTAAEHAQRKRPPGSGHGPPG